MAKQHYLPQKTKCSCTGIVGVRGRTRALIAVPLGRGAPGLCNPLISVTQAGLGWVPVWCKRHTHRVSLLKWSVITSSITRGSIRIEWFPSWLQENFPVFFLCSEAALPRSFFCKKILVPDPCLCPGVTRLAGAAEVLSCARAARSAATPRLL